MNVIGKATCAMALLCLTGMASEKVAGKIRYRRLHQISGESLVRRPYQTNTPQIYSEWAPYWLGYNYMSYWRDRPLLTDVRMRGNSQRAHQEEVRYLKKYGIDGLAGLDYFSAFKNQIKWEEETGVSHLLVMPGYCYPNDYDKLKDVIIAALKSPVTARIGGKIVCPCYWGLSPDQTKEMKERLVREPEIGDRILLLTEMPFGEFHGEFSNCIYKNIEPPQASLDKYRAAVRHALDCADGLVLENVVSVPSAGNPGDKMWRVEPTPSFHKYMLPIILDELKKPEYRHKLLSSYLKRGYVNHLSGNTLGEYGTEQLRLSFDNLCKISPDLYLLFEWNEVNENTCFQPTVNNGWATGRVVRFYANLIKERKQTPLEGDDTERPNLILSLRQQAIFGELVNYEILNVPDGSWRGTVMFQLRLKDEKGNVIMTLPAEKVSAEKLEAVAYQVATEDFGGALAVVPELVVWDRQEKRQVLTGFDYTRLTASANTRYKETQQAIRDLLEPEKVSFKVSRVKDEYRLQASVTAPEKLHALEILNCHEEAAADDPDHEFDFSELAVFHGNFTSMDLLLKTNGTFKVHKVDSWNVRSDGLCHGTCDTIRKDEASATVYTYFWWMRSPFILSVPRRQVQDALLEIEYPAPVGKCTVRLGDVWKRQQMDVALGKNVRLELSRANRLMDYPRPLERQKGTIDCQMPLAGRQPILQLRAIDARGRIWRSAPVVARSYADRKQMMTVYSEFENKPVRKAMAAARIPVIDYEFKPGYGRLLVNGFDALYNARLGGGFSYLDPFWKTPIYMLKKNYKSFAPTWKQQGENWYLNFDGMANYVNFPQETLPRGAYSLTMEIRTPGNREQVLLRSFALDPGTLQMIITKDNELVGMSAKNSWNPRFNTGLKIPADTWCTIRVTYDFKNLIFEVDGKKSIHPFDGRGFTFKPSCFGGSIVPFPNLVGSETKFFKGDLRRFSVVHDVLNQ